MEILNRLQFKHDEHLYDSFDEIRESVFFAVADEKQRENAALYAEPIVFKYKGKDENHPNIVLGIGSFGDGYTIDRKNSYFLIDTAQLEADIADLNKREKQDRKDIDATSAVVYNAITALGFEKDGTLLPYDDCHLISGDTTIKEILHDIYHLIVEEVKNREEAVKNEQKAREDADHEIRAEFTAADTKIREDFTKADTELREELRKEDAAIRKELLEEITSARTDFTKADTELREELRKEDAAIRKELQAEITSARTEFIAADTELDKKITSAVTKAELELKEAKKELHDADDQWAQTLHKEIEAFDERVDELEKELMSATAETLNLAKEYTDEQIEKVNGRIDKIEEKAEATHKELDNKISTEQRRAQEEESKINDIIDNIIVTNDKVLSMDANKQISATLDLQYDNKYIFLKGINGAEIAKIDVSDFIKDGMIKKVEMVTDPSDREPGTYLHIIWNTDAELAESYISLTKLINIYTVAEGSENYMSINDYKISLKVDTVGGLASNSALDAEIRRANEIEATILANTQDNAKKISTNVEAIKTLGETVSGNTESIRNNASDIADVRKTLGDGFGEGVSYTHVINEVSGATKTLADSAATIDAKLTLLSGATSDYMKKTDATLGDGFGEGISHTHVINTLSAATETLSGSVITNSEKVNELSGATAEYMEYIKDTLGEGFDPNYTIKHEFDHVYSALTENYDKVMLEVNKGVTDVKVDGVSVVKDRVAEIDTTKFGTVKDVTYGGVSLVNKDGIATLDGLTIGGGVDNATIQALILRISALEKTVAELEKRLEEGLVSDIQPLDNDIIVQVSGTTTYIGLTGVTQQG